MAISVTEKEHWKNSITKRIDRKIQALKDDHKALIAEIGQKAAAQALKELGIKDDYEKLIKMDEEAKALKTRNEALTQRVFGKIFPGETSTYYPRNAIDAAIQSAKQKAERSLILTHEEGRQIARLEREKDNLLDTIWLATSPRQATQLWEGLVSLLGEEVTEFQQEILLGKNRPAKA